MVYEKIKEILETEFEVEDVNPDMVIREDLDLNSIGILEFIMLLEEEFDAKVEDDDMDNIITIQDIADYISKTINEND